LIPWCTQLLPKGLDFLGELVLFLNKAFCLKLMKALRNGQVYPVTVYVCALNR